MNTSLQNKRLRLVCPLTLGLLYLLLATSCDFASAQSPQLSPITNEQPATYSGGSTNAPQVPTKALAQPAGQQGPDAGQVVSLSGVTVNAIQTGAPTVSYPAQIIINNAEQFGLRANPAGIFPRVTVPANASISVHLNVSPNSNIEVIVLDGGTVGNQAHSSMHVADANGNIDFIYIVSADPGNHRLRLVQGAQKQTLNFWIGPDLLMKTASGAK